MVGLKNAKAGSLIEIYQERQFRLDVRPQQQVLWFLSERTNEGLAMTIGHLAGHFEIRQRHFEGRSWYEAETPFENRGLWTGSLWELASSDGRRKLVDPVRVRRKLQEHGIADAAKVDFLMSFGDKSSKGPLPLDLLMAVVRVLQ
jgi:hypothetical protein